MGRRGEGFPNLHSIQSDRIFSDISVDVKAIILSLLLSPYYGSGNLHLNYVNDIAVANPRGHGLKPSSLFPRKRRCTHWI